MEFSQTEKVPLSQPISVDNLMDASLSKNIEVIERGALANDHTVFFNVTGVKPVALDGPI